MNNAISLKKYILLKKSYGVRKLYDIFYNSSYIIVVHIDNITHESIENIRKELKKIKVNNFLLNKDDFLSLLLNSIAKGPSLVFYAEHYFYDELKVCFNKNNLLFDAVYNKTLLPLANNFFYDLVHSYKNSFFVLNLSFLKLISFFKILLIFYKFILSYFFFKLYHVLFFSYVLNFYLTFFKKVK
jgi:hypothetical protein